jgi:hypothetical protein
MSIFSIEGEELGHRFLELFLENSGNGIRSVDSDADVILGLALLDLSGPIYASLTYAYVNQVGWFSNFATVVVHVFPPHAAAPENSVTTQDSDGRPIQYASPPGTDLVYEGWDPRWAGTPAPPDLQFPYGLAVLIVSNVHPAGAFVTVTITLPQGAPHVITYYKYGIQSPLDRNHFYSFRYSSLTGVGAKFTSDSNTGQQVILLYLRDGGVGDDDLSVNGVIVDPGGLAAFTDPTRNFVASLYDDVVGRGPTDAEMTHWLQKLDRGASRLRVVQTIWNSDEHRRVQVEEWSMQYLRHLPGARHEARWVSLLRRGRGEIAVEQAILTSPDYRRAHPTIASFIAGLNQDVLGHSGDSGDSTEGHLKRHRGSVSRDLLARQILTSQTAAAILAQQDATTFLGRSATIQEIRADQVQLGRNAAAPARLAEKILASQAFYDFVNSALPSDFKLIRRPGHAHSSTRHPRGH